MAVFKCKMCGGDMEITSEDTIVTCPHCGIVQSLPDPEPVSADAPEDTPFHSMGDDALLDTPEAPTLAPAEEGIPEELSAVDVEATEEETDTQAVAGDEAAEEDTSDEEEMSDEVPATEEVSEEAPTEETSGEPLPEAGTNEVPPEALALLEQAVSCLELSNWDEAIACCDQVLAIHPENAWAYLAMLMAEMNVSKPENLKYLADPFDTNPNYQQAIAYADEHLRSELTGYIDHINERNDAARLESIYTQAHSMMQSAETEAAFKEAAGLFESIPHYTDAAELAQVCYEKAELTRKDSVYAQGVEKMAAGALSDYGEALALFESIPGWHDADEKAAVCKQKIDEMAVVNKSDDLRETFYKKKKKALARRSMIIRLCVTCVGFVVLLTAILLFIFVPKSRYNNAVDLKNTGKYSEAITAFEELGRYKDSKDQIVECRYLQAKALMGTLEYELAIPIFEELEDYEDSADQIELCKTGIIERDYNRGVALLAEGKTVEGYELLISLGDYKDSAKRAKAVFPQYKYEKTKVAEIGGSLFLGKYEQDNDKDNGAEDIEWLILDIQDGRALVVSKHALEVKPFHFANTAVNWEGSSIRTWLNSNFIDTAFNEYEKTQIPTVTVPADVLPESTTEPGNDTEDRVFLLSYTEVTTYFTSDEQRRCVASVYAAEEGAYVKEETNRCWWWLRTPGFYQDTGMSVGSTGAINEFGIGVDRDNGTIRPAMWVELETNSES